MLDSDLNKSNKKTVVFLCRQILFPLAFIRRPISPTTTTFLLFSLCSSSAFNLQSRPTFQRETPHTIIITRPLLHKRAILFVSLLSLVVTTHISCFNTQQLGICLLFHICVFRCFPIQTDIFTLKNTWLIQPNVTEIFFDTHWISKLELRLCF